MKATEEIKHNLKKLIDTGDITEETLNAAMVTYVRSKTFFEKTWK